MNTIQPKTFTVVFSLKGPGFPPGVVKDCCQKTEDISKDLINTRKTKRRDTNRRYLGGNL